MTVSTEEMMGSMDSVELFVKGLACLVAERSAASRIGTCRSSIEARRSQHLAGQI
jgi:uncharacterized protein (DUF1499 family)